MDSMQKAAFIIAQAAMAQGELMGMAAENQHRIAVGRTDLYTEEAFAAVPIKYGLGHNDVLTYLQS